MAISVKSPPEPNSVVGFQSHKIWKKSQDCSFTSACVWYESSKQRGLRKGDSEKGISNMPC